MKRPYHQFWLTSSIALVCLSATSPTQAQISPDATLGAESSVVTPNVSINGLPSDQIDGGAIRGANLFHSFEQFNVDAGRGAYFTNPVGIENILSRVTGGSRSDILGTLGVLGNANLFLINPNGIIFGPNASLDVGGSFVATTANAVGLSETGLFSASFPETSNLLTVKPSALFFNAIATQAIVNQSQAQSLSGETNSIDSPVGLQVPTGQTLALVGGDIVLEFGNLTAAEGRIELGSVAGVGEVSLSQTGNSWVFGYDEIDAFGDIRLEGGALVDVSGQGGGDIQIQGARLEVTQGAGIFADTLGTEAGGEVLVHTTEAIALSDSLSVIAANVFGSGTGGDLKISTGQLIVQDGAQLQAATAEGLGGNLTVTASDSVQLIGTDTDGNLSSLFAGTYITGVAGNLTIDTKKLIIQDGALALTSTLGKGKAGNLNIRASTVEMVGTSQEGSPSALFARAEEGSTGAGGNLTIETGQLIIRDGAQVAVTTFGEGDAGDLTVLASEVRLIGIAPDDILSKTGLPIISGLFAGTEPGSQGAGGNLTIETSRLIVQDGAEAQASTFGEGNAGSLIVRATDSVELIGRTPDNRFASGLLAVSGLKGVFTEAQGKGGDLRIETGELIVRDRAGVTVSSTSTASDALGAGNLQIQAQTIRLEDQGKLSAQTNSGQGGNIELQVQDLLLLRRNSEISTTAGIAGAGGNGGNITIDNTPFIVAVPSENSDIKANAFLGQGGKVTINAQSIFGLAQRNLKDLQTLLETADPQQLDPINLSSSDITAISQTNPELSGEVTINTPDVDPSQGLVANPAELVDISKLIASSCGAGGENEFIVTGRGGLPPNPSDTISSDTVWSDLRSQTRQAQNRTSSESAIQQTLPAAGQLVEAQGWVINNFGEVVLTATAPNATPKSSTLTPVSCHTQ